MGCVEFNGYLLSPRSVPDAHRGSRGRKTSTASAGEASRESCEADMLAGAAPCQHPPGRLCARCEGWDPVVPHPRRRPRLPAGAKLTVQSFFHSSCLPPMPACCLEHLLCAGPGRGGEDSPSRASVAPLSDGVSPVGAATPSRWELVGRNPFCYGLRPRPGNAPKVSSAELTPASLMAAVSGPHG